MLPKNCDHASLLACHDHLQFRDEKIEAQKGLVLSLQELIKYLPDKNQNPL